MDILSPLDTDQLQTDIPDEVPGLLPTLPLSEVLSDIPIYQLPMTRFLVTGCPCGDGTRTEVIHIRRIRNDVDVSEMLQEVEHPQVVLPQQAFCEVKFILNQEIPSHQSVTRRYEKAPLAIEEVSDGLP